MSLRRLWVLVRALPEDALVRAELAAAEEKAKKPTPDLIRSRQEAFNARNAARAAQHG